MQTEVKLEIKENQYRQKKSGAFFNYLHNTEHDFSKYQLFSEFSSNNYTNNCLYVALSHCDKITQTQLNILKTAVTNRIVPQCKLSNLAKMMHVQLKL